MNWSTIGYVVTVLIGFVLAAAIMESGLIFMVRKHSDTR